MSATVLFATETIEESLCCCEYENMDGEKSHVLACCCDCVALDETFDKIFKCEPVNNSTLQRLFSTIADRCRLPTVFGRGAIKIRLDIATPILLVPTCLYLATLHPALTVISFIFMPAFILTFHALWRRSLAARRTKLFFSWAVTSAMSCYMVFQCFVVAFREVLLWEIMIVFTLTFILFYLLYHIRLNPGQIRPGAKRLRGHKRTHSNIPHNNRSSKSSALPLTVNGLDEDDVKWVDGGTSGQHTDTGIYQPRAGFCKICEDMIAVRDHHCIWIDSCVGGSNHRQFVLAMVLFIVTGLYGSHLTLTTICTPKMYYDWFLLPNDCRWLYVDFLTAICFVTTIYSLIVVCIVSVNLLFQLILISQNVTSHELSRAAREGRTKWVVLVSDNPYNRGLFRNWLDFLLLDGREPEKS